MNALLPAAAAVLAIAFAVAAGSLPLAARIGRQFGITAEPASQAQGTAPIPVFGGASIIIAIAAALALSRLLPTWIAIGTGGLFVLGSIDDARPLKPRQKLIAQLAII